MFQNRSSSTELNPSSLNAVLTSHDIENIEDLPAEIERKKQHIKDLENQGKKATATKRKESLAELEELQKLVDKMQVAKLKTSEIGSSIIPQEILDKLSDHDIENIEDLPSEIENRRQQIVELENRGKKATAIKRKESLKELEEIEELIRKIKTGELKKTTETSSFTITQEILDQLSAHDITIVEDLPVEIESRRQQIKQLEAQGKKLTAIKRKKSVEELEELQRLVGKVEVDEATDSVATIKQALEQSIVEDQHSEINHKPETYSLPEVLPDIPVKQAKNLEIDQETLATIDEQEGVTGHELDSSTMCAENKFQQFGSKSTLDIEEQCITEMHAEQLELTATTENTFGINDYQEQQSSESSGSEKTSSELKTDLDTEEEPKEVLKEGIASSTFVTDSKSELKQSLMQPKSISDKANKALSILLSVPEISDSIKQEESIEARKYNELYQRYSCVLTNMPDCAEKSLSLLWIHFESEQFRIKLNNIVESFLTIENVNVVFNQLKIQLEIEGLNDRFVKQTMRKIDAQFVDGGYDPKQTKELSDDFFQILKQIQPVDIDLMLNYIDKALTAAENIKNKDILLLLGGTGTGKCVCNKFVV